MKDCIVREYGCSCENECKLEKRRIEVGSFEEDRSHEFHGMNIRDGIALVGIVCLVLASTFLVLEGMQKHNDKVNQESSVVIRY